MRIMTIIFWTLALMLLAVGGFAASQAVAPRTALAPRNGPQLASAKTWGYQLQNIKAGLIPDAVDVLVVDYSRDGTGERAFSARDVGFLRKRSDGRPRIVLCYLSIGEAESYRPYWLPAWGQRAPPWLGAENATWKGNYAVRFWDPAWQRLIVHPQPTWMERALEALSPHRVPYLEQIIEAGFDGVYLDRVDAYESRMGERPTAKSEMVQFVARLAAHARGRRPGFLIVPQNAEELLPEPAYLAVIDGVAKEDLFYGEGGDGVENDPSSTRASLELLRRAKADGRPVFVVEYLADAQKQAAVQRQVGPLGFLPTFTSRALNEPPVVLAPVANTVPDADGRGSPAAQR